MNDRLNLPMTRETAASIALATPPNSPAFQLACDLCTLRLLDPFHMNGYGLLNWQVAIAEELLRSELCHEIEECHRDG